MLVFVLPHAAGGGDDNTAESAAGDIADYYEIEDVAMECKLGMITFKYGCILCKENVFILINVTFYSHMTNTP